MNSTKAAEQATNPECASQSVHLGLIVREYRLTNDLAEKEFAAAMGRSISWVKKFEKRGKCYERTLKSMFDRFPAIKQRALEGALS